MISLDVQSSVSQKLKLKYGDIYKGFQYSGHDIEISVFSHRKLPFKCKCGKIKDIGLCRISSDLTVSCYECNHIELEHGSIYMGFTYTGKNVYVSSHSHKKFPFKCICGKIKDLELASITIEKTKTCGHCNDFKLEMGDNYHDFIYVGPTILISPHSNKKLPFKCKCGNFKDISIHYITKGDTRSCGNCRKTVFDWYVANKQTLASNVSFSVEDFPSNGIIPEEDIINTRDPFLARCPACNSSYKPRLKDIKRGLSLTCGCTSDRISAGSRNIHEFLNGIGIESELEYEVGGRKFDVFVPHHSTLIEFNGIHWHSIPGSKARDYDKYMIAINNGFQYISIFEDEWKYKNNIIKAIIKNRFGLSIPKYILRPSNCTISKVGSSEVNDLYDKFHYIGKCFSRYNYGIFYNGSIIGSVSFRRPSRQNCLYDYEISRMVMNPDFRVNGIWSKIIQQFMLEFSPKLIVTFSDNRLFSGNTYSKMGFVFDDDVNPDYYWVKGSKRLNKSGLRKQPWEVGTETELREAQGYRKIWDLGKKRWVWKSSM